MRFFLRGILTAVTQLIICVAVGQTRGAEMQFDRTLADFGTFSASQTAQRDFVITNNGNAPLVITTVKVSCTCTKVKWPRKPISPGGSEVITVTYKPDGEGAFYKDIEVVSNARNSKQKLTIKGVVTK